MSNIYTSYIRVYRNDRKKIEDNEVKFIVKSIVKIHDRYGSYNVPIIIENNIEDNYLDIQYGSGKGLYNLSDFADDHENEYTIWHRFNNDGNGIDQIEQLYHYQKNIPENDLRNCKYSFDEVTTLNLDSFIDNSTLEWIKYKDEWKAKVTGFYFGDNNQFDLESKLKDSSKKYESKRICDRFEWCSEPEIDLLFNEALKNTTSEIRFYSKGRLTSHFSWRKAECLFHSNEQINRLEFIGLAYDDWDNCADDFFLKYHNEYKLTVHNKV